MSGFALRRSWFSRLRRDDSNEPLRVVPVCEYADRINELLA